MEGKSFKLKYTLLERVQEGSYGTVFKAKCNNTQNFVAIKVFKSPNQIGLPISYIREKYIYDVLSSQHLPKIIQTNVHEQEPIMVMEWLHSSFAKAVLSGKKFAVKELFRQILVAISEFHRNGFVHRDLKPGNIMLGQKADFDAKSADEHGYDLTNYEVKIIDLGMAKECDVTDQDMTNLVGSFSYRAPELLLGTKHYGYEVDIWALGCIFYCIRTGSRLFKGESQLQQFQLIVEKLGVNLSTIKDQNMLKTLQNWKIEESNDNWNLADETILNEVEFDLLRKMVVFDPAKRSSCEQLILHPYFQ